MGIPFVPMRGQILMCDMEFGKIDPEMGKERRVVVVSPRSYNHRHGYDPGRCLVVPFSATAPFEMKPAYVRFAAGVYQSLTEETWAYCDCLRSASHARLDRVSIAGMNLNERLSTEDIARIDEALRHALGIA